MLPFIVMLGYCRFFLHGVLMKMRSCSVHVKSLIKVRLLKGGAVQLDFH